MPAGAKQKSITGTVGPDEPVAVLGSASGSVDSDSESDLCLCKFFKLGYASKPKNRLANIKSSNPFNIRLIFEYETPQPKTLEYLVHHFFKEHHYQGEWFLIPENMMEAFIIEELFVIF